MRGDFLFVQPFLHPPGGGEGVANWMLQALTQRGQPTLLTWRRPDFDQIDAYYGTTLASARLRCRTVLPRLVSGALKVSRLPLETLKLSLLMAAAKRQRPHFRHCLSAFNDLDLGGGAVQYMHFPCNDYRSLALASTSGLYARVWPHYLRLCHWVADWSAEGVRDNLTLANSAWTAEHYRTRYQAAVHRVLHPPPLGSPSTIPQPRREAFLSIGRITPPKRWPVVVAIVERLRELGHPVELTLAGSRAAPEHLAELESLVARHQSWVSLRLDCTREELDHLIAIHKYGLHGMVDEHYGMAVAELVLGGCLTFVHDSGGQVEIVPQEEARYTSVDDAVARLSAMLSDRSAQRALAEKQALHGRRFTRESFLEGFHAFLDDLETGRIALMADQG